MPKHIRRLEAQLHSASGRSSKIIKDAEGIEAVVEVPGRGTLTLSVHSGAGTRCGHVPRRQTTEGKKRPWGASWWRWAYWVPKRSCPSMVPG